MNSCNRFWTAGGEPTSRRTNPDVHQRCCVGEREVKGLGRRYLRDQADVRDGGTLAMAEPTARGMLGKQRLDPGRPQPGSAPDAVRLQIDLHAARLAGCRVYSIQGIVAARPAGN